MIKNVFAVLVLAFFGTNMAMAGDRHERVHNHQTVVVVDRSEVGQHQKQKQAQKQQAVSQNSYKSTSVSAPGINGTGQSWCVSGGWATGAAGICAPSRHARVMFESEMVKRAGGDQMKHLCMYNRRIAKSQCE